jgi:hypothetical protein
MSLYILTSWGLIPIGNVIAGTVAERSSPSLALAAGGIVTFIATAGVALAFPEIRRLEARAAEPQRSPASA